MIRKANKSDTFYINEIGSSIHDNFNKKYDIDSFLEYDYASIYVYEENDELKGFIQIEEHFEVIDIINIAVNKEYYHQGIASSLLEYIIDNINHERIMLEVRESNINAINLYKKYNFREINRRKKYYGNEDAIIMERSVLNVN